MSLFKNILLANVFYHTITLCTSKNIIIKSCMKPSVAPEEAA